MTEKEIIEDDAKIGKDVIESLTLGMYEDCRFIFREYIQNAADQVDKAVKSSLLERGEEEIHIQIDRDKRIIMVEDNATGIPQDRVMPILRNVAHSTKKRGVDKGFRGIGRLGGLGYCSKLTFVTSYAGEEVKSVMTWDADLLKLIINDRENEAEAKDVLVEVTDLKTEKEEIGEHYFRVILEDEESVAAVVTAESTASATVVSVSVLSAASAFSVSAVSETEVPPLISFSVTAL